MLNVPRTDNVDFVLSDGYFLEVPGPCFLHVLIYALLTKAG